MYRYEEMRILIWGKTYPEMSSKYLETVCTGGVLEDGRPVRLYPIQYRYMDGDEKFSKYQWVTLKACQNPQDVQIPVIGNAKSGRWAGFGVHDAPENAR